MFRLDLKEAASMGGSGSLMDKPATSDKWIEQIQQLAGKSFGMDSPRSGHMFG
jgi:hypothetical protein